LVKLLVRQPLHGLPDMFLCPCVGFYTWPSLDKTKRYTTRRGISVLLENSPQHDAISYDAHTSHQHRVASWTAKYQ